MPETEVFNNLENQQFELRSGGSLGFLQYQQFDNHLILIHTEVPHELEGKGIGAALAKAGLEYARQNQYKVIPSCPFVQSYLKRHPEYQDLVEESV